MTLPPSSPEVSRWLVFRNRSFQKLWLALLCGNFSIQIQTVAVAWQVYDITGSPLDLAFVGLSQFLTSLLLVLITGAVADRFSRRSIIVICLVLETVSAGGLFVFTISGSNNILIVFSLLAVLGTARAFYNTARQAIIPNLVSGPLLGNAITLSVAANQIATIVGPVLGGLLFGILPELAYSVSVVLLLLAALLVLSIPRPTQQVEVGHASWTTFVAGFKYIWNAKIVLGAISLDMFAVLLGGATALMPVYARDILEIGPTGLGLLKAAPAVGAIIIGFALINFPIRRNAGKMMFSAIFLFGIFTLIFAVSTVVWISILALALAGGCDMVSVFVRNTLIQVWTPDNLRGRVTAVSQLFVGASNEFGAFRAGASAALIGAVPAVVVGGIGTLAISILWYRKFPALRNIQHLERPD
jgi:MFS family permease